MRAALALVLLAAAVLVPASPGSAAAGTRIPLSPLSHSGVGRVDGTRTFIALSVHGGKLRAYVCDGTLKRDATISTWFRHRWDGHRKLTLRAGGHTLKITAVRRDGRIAGRLDGARFSARPGGRPAGLFTGRKGHLRTTWIVLRGGAKRGTFVPTRPPKCRAVLVSGPGGPQWVVVC